MKIIHSISDLGIDSKSKVLIIMPHPDDETAFCAGFITQSCALGSDVTLCCMTQGEKSTHRFGVGNNDLGPWRAKELERSSTLMGVKKLVQKDFPDGLLEQHISEMRIFIAKLIKQGSYDLILTLEPFGVYGHPDHIALTKAVSEVCKSDINSPTLLYATVDEHWKASKGASAMAKIESSPLSPEFCLKLDKEERKIKLESFKCHGSQFKVDANFVKRWKERAMLENEFFTLAA
ncbi:MAG: PIG-L deacetylase family protein [Candidatus Roizmanbacteria bacterium]